MEFSPIAIVGRSCVFPGALTPEQLWANVAAGKDATGSSPEGRWRVGKRLVLAASGQLRADQTPTDRGGYVDGFSAIFQPEGFAIPAAELLRYDMSAQWLLHTGREALRNAGIGLGALPGRAGMTLGVLSLPTETFAEYAESVWLGLDRSDLAVNRFHPGLPTQMVARALGLADDAFALDAACASSLYAIKLACDQLQDGRRDLMLAGAVSRADDLFLHLGFASLKAISPTGNSRPFHTKADGLLPAEGAGFVVLKRLEDARRDGDRIYGVIRGVGLSNDGRTAGLLSPSAVEQERAIRSAYRQAGLEPAQVMMMECHATGTPIGDATELRSAGAVFQGLHNVPIGSVKSNLGHPLTAAGMAGLIKLLGAMEAGVRPKTLHVKAPADRIAELAASPFRVLSENEPWTVDGPRRAALNGFGFGGNNAHLIVEEWQGQSFAARPAAPPPVPPRIALVAMGVTAGSARGVEAFTKALFFGSLESRRTEEIALGFEGLGFPPSDLRLSIPQQSFALEAAAEAIGKTDFSNVDRDRVAVLMGAECDPESARVGLRTRRLAETQGVSETMVPHWTAAGVTGRLTNMVANRISNAHDLRGPSFIIGSEELSGIAALKLACRSLRKGEIDAAVVGAVDLSCEAVHEAAMRVLLGDDAGDAGDAAVIFILKRMEDAERVLAEVDPVAVEGQVEEWFGGADQTSVAATFGSAHAAAGLLEAAGAALCVAHGALYPARPWITQGQRLARVETTTVGGATDRITFGSVAGQKFESLVASTVPRLVVCSGRNRAELMAGLADAWEKRALATHGPMRLAILAADETEWRRKRDRAQQILDSGVPVFSGDGIHFRETPVTGELGFVFPGGASSYAGMGRTLLTALPEISLGLLDAAPKTTPSLDWLFGRSATAPGPSEKLAGSIFLSQVHARLTRHWLELKPSAAIGMSAGETSSLLAFDVWRQGDDFFKEFIDSGVFTRYLAGQYEVVNGVPWESWVIMLPERDLAGLLADEPGLRLLAIHAPGEYLIAGDAASCARAVARTSKTGAQPVDFPAVVHCPELGPFAKRWRELHDRETWPMPQGVRMYGMSLGKHYEVTRSAAADALTAQALETLDYPRVIRQAWDDGVRIFLEHGARGGCTYWIRRILGDREHLAIALDSPVTDSLTQAIDAVAQLVVAGVEVNLTRFVARIESARKDESGPSKARLRLAAHAPAVVLPEPPMEQQAPVTPPAAPVVQPAPAPEPIVESEPVEVMGGSISADLMEPTTTDDRVSVFALHAQEMSAHHAGFMDMSRTAHERFLQSSQDAMARMMAVAPAVFEMLPAALPPVPMKPAPAPAPAPVAPQTLSPIAPPAAPPVAPVKNEPAKTLVWNREQLEIMATDKISRVYGPDFAALDTYAKICRLPMPPMLLVDRVTAIEGKPGGMGLGSIVTETDVRQDSWYLLQDRIPAGLMIESGQADMLLISWLGIDFHCKGERVYRMLGCEVTFQSQLAKPGETLRYEIRITGHARQGGIRIFFFEYDCYIGTRLVLSVRKGQAGFFSDAELATSVGVLWDPRTTPPSPGGKGPQGQLPGAGRYNEQQVLNAAYGRAYECFGRGFEHSAAQQRPPVFSSQEMLQFDRVTELNYDGGPWGRGYIRAESTVKPEHFLFTSHFKDDPCLPGTVMLEGCWQLMAFYMMSMGLTLNRDGWRFEPLHGEAVTVSCRGQVLPSSKELISELFIDEFIDGEEPVLIADTMGTVDGQRAFYGHRLGLRLVKGHLLDSQYEKPLPPLPGQRPPASVNGVLLDEMALLHTAWGPPSKAFGPPYGRFDGAERCPRLPAPPYLFISRVTEIIGEFGVEKAGGVIEAEYAVRGGDWYFAENSHREMPYSVLLEVALQPCGWLSCFTGVPVHRDEPLFFRNLDGSANLFQQVPDRDGIITTRAKLTSVSKFGSITLVTFDVHLKLDGEPLLDVKTSFGFFGKADLMGQVGLPPSPAEAARRAESSDFYCDLRLAPERYFGQKLHLASGRLLMIDEITGLWLASDSQGGRIRGRKNLHPSQWFFKAHFHQDPVQPGSLGLEALVQTLQFFAIHQGLGNAYAEPQFELLPDSVWKYRGQAIPQNSIVETEVIVKEVTVTPAGTEVRAEGWLWVDGLRVYHLAQIGLLVRNKG